MNTFSEQDINQINQHGLTIDNINRQIDNFVKKFPYANIIEPANVSNGIFVLNENEIKEYIQTYHEYCKNHKIVKFVPASGAATRMFKDLFEFIKTSKKNLITQKVLENIDKFAFYDDLKQILPPNPNCEEIISCLLTENGLNYGKLPKALIPFHKYLQYNRTALEEHLVEGAQYANCANLVNIHFTASPEHIHGFKSLLTRVIPEYESKYGVKYNIEISKQKNSTDTIAVTIDNKPFRDEKGELLFRPSGHGALIENLNEIDADIIFIKNIDNVCNDQHRFDTIKYKSALAGKLIKTQEKIFYYIKNINSVNLQELRDFIEKDLCVKISGSATIEDYKNILNRPIRVCGVVRNIGAPGGGPFWVKDKFDQTTLQIIESNQISPNKRDIMNFSSHFNPVDLVCGIKDINGHKYDLTKFIDEDTGFISEKSYNGQPLKAMERPGLWNGAMANWNTIFIEVPITTFTPVKVVIDLLSSPHNN